MCHYVFRVLRARSRATRARSRTNPFVGTRLYSFSRCCVDVMAPSTDKRLTRDLMFAAVPYLQPTRAPRARTLSAGGATRETRGGARALVAEHLGHARNLVARRNDERNHRCAVAVRVPSRDGCSGAVIGEAAAAAARASLSSPARSLTRARPEAI